MASKFYAIALLSCLSFSAHAASVTAKKDGTICVIAVVPFSDMKKNPNYQGLEGSEPLIVSTTPGYSLQTVEGVRAGDRIYIEGLTGRVSDSVSGAAFVGAGTLEAMTASAANLVTGKLCSEIGIAR